MKPATFLAFFATVTSMVLTAAQRVLACVQYDGVSPAELKGKERAIAAKLFGPVESVSGFLRGVVVMVKGARVGGTLLGAVRLLHLAMTVSLMCLAPGEQAFAVIVAPDLRLARQALRYILGVIERTKDLADSVVSRTADSISLRRLDGRVVTIECLPATRGGSALRGRSLVAALLSEASFFRDESAVVNDVEVFKAIAPRIVPGGQIIIESTPWAEAGLLFELDQTNWGTPKTCLVAHCPTTLMREDERTRAMVERERQRDPDNALREFDAEFMPAGSGAFFDPATIDRAVVNEERPRAGVDSFAGDPAFSRDSSGGAGVRTDGPMHFVFELIELRPGKGQPLVPSKVIASYADWMRPYGANALASDVHYVESVREHLQEHGLELVRAPGGTTGKAEVHMIVRALFNEGRVRLLPHPLRARLVAQLKGIISKPTSGGGLAISAPRRAGNGHGDIASACVLALWRAHRRGTSDYVGTEFPYLPASSFAGWLDDSTGGGERTKPAPVDPGRIVTTFGGFN